MAIAVCEDQARNVVIENCSSIYQQFFLTNRIYGYGGLKSPNAVLPRIHKVDVGYTKYVFDVNTPTGVLNVSSMYVETTLSLGYLGASGTYDDNLCASFTGCEFNFWTLSGRQPDFSLWNLQPVAFSGCAFYSNGNYLGATVVQPMVFYNQAALLLTNCVFDQVSMGPDLDPNPQVAKLYKGSFAIAFENPGLVRFSDSRFVDTSFTSGQAMITMDYDASDPAKLRRQPLPSPDYVIEGTRLRCFGTKLKSARVATSVTLRQSGTEGEALFDPSSTALVNVGDLIYLSGTSSYAPQWYDSAGAATTSGSAHFVGIVKSIAGATATVKYVPQALWALLAPLTVSLDVRYFARYHDLTIGTLTNLSNIISNVNPDPSPNNPGVGHWKPNDRIEHPVASPGIVPGTYITGVSTNQLTLSLSATAAATNAPLVSADTATHQIGGSARPDVAAVSTARYKGARKLIWDAPPATGATQSGEATTRMYAAATGPEISWNAKWDGSQWSQDQPGNRSVKLEIRENDIHYRAVAAGSANWADNAWTADWSVTPPAGATQSLGTNGEWTSPGSVDSYLAADGYSNSSLGGGTNFRKVFPGTASSHTFTLIGTSRSTNCSWPPSPYAYHARGVGAYCNLSPSGYGYFYCIVTSS